MQSIFRCCWCWYWLIFQYSKPTTIGQQCVPSFRHMCTFSRISTSNSGWGAAIRSAPTGSILVNKLLVPSAPATVPAFLQIAGKLTVGLEFTLYKEKALVLTGGNELQSLRISSSPALEQLVNEPNDHLRELHIYNSSLKYLPQTIRGLGKLQALSVRQSKLTHFSLDLFSETQMLREVTFTSNMISVLVSTNQSVCIERLNLGENRVTSVDMVFFSQIRNLTRLALNSNRIIQLSSSANVVLPFLSQLDLYLNRLTTVQTQMVEMPRLVSVSLGSNNLTSFPKILSKYPLMQNIDLTTNQLISLDLSVLQPFKKLSTLELSNNRLTSVAAKQPTKLENFEQLAVGYNGLTLVNFTGCDFPKLKYLFLGFNRITTIQPSIFTQFPKMSLFLTGTNVSCSELSRYTNEMQTRQLFVDFAWGTAGCSTGSYVEITKTQKACCSEQLNVAV